MTGRSRSRLWVWEEVVTMKRRPSLVTGTMTNVRGKAVQKRGKSRSRSRSRLGLLLCRRT